MKERSCVGLGEFGTWKVEHKRFVPTRTCRVCGQLVAGDNLGVRRRTGWVYCVACYHRKKWRNYWAAQMRAYFASQAPA